MPFDPIIIHVRVTLECKRRVQYAVEQRKLEASRTVTAGEILMELIKQYLPPVPEEAAGNGAAPVIRKRAGRKRKAQALPAEG